MNHNLARPKVHLKATQFRRKSHLPTQPSVLPNTDLANAARALPDPKALKIKVIERPAHKTIVPTIKKPINSHFVPQGRTTTIASSSLSDHPKESDRQSTSEPGEPGSESDLEIITEATGRLCSKPPTLPELPEDETLESYPPDFQPLLQTVKLQLHHYREVVLKKNDNLKIISLKVASVTQEGLSLHIPLEEFLAIFDQWNPLEEFHRLADENDLLMEELEAQGINTKRSTIVPNKFKDTQAKDQAQDTEMEIDSTTQRQHHPIPSQGSSKNSQSTSQPVAHNLPQQVPRPNQRGQGRNSRRRFQERPWTDDRRSQPQAHPPQRPGQRNSRMNRRRDYQASIHEEMIRIGRTLQEKNIDKNASDVSKQIQLRPFTEIKNLIGQKADSTDEKLKSIKFLSENVVSLLNTLKLLLDFSKTLLSSSQSSTDVLGSINKSQTDVLHLLQSSIVNKTDLSFLSSHVKNLISSDEKLQLGFDHLFSLVFDKLSSFEKCMKVCTSDNEQTLKKHMRENSTQISSFLAEATPIKSNDKTEDHLEPHRSVENHCAKEHLEQKQIITNSTMTSNPVCACHDKILELKLDHELLNEVNDKIENLIDGTIEPIKYLTEKINMLEYSQNQQFQQLLTKFDSIKSLINLSHKNTKEYRSNSPELTERNKPYYPQKDFDEGRHRAMESPFHPRTKPFNQPNPFVPSSTRNEYRPTQEHRASTGLEFSSETAKIINQSLSRAETWPTFSGAGDYNHIDFMTVVDNIQQDSRCADEVVVNRLRDMMTGVANQWFTSVRNVVGNQSWAFWKERITEKYGTNHWRKSMLHQFERDRYVPGEVPAATWVTRQYKRMTACEPQCTPEIIIFKLMSRMDNETT
ncbi:hypothetical protein MJO29_008585 [Puccinia striiformis f. sp. tritici]|nr:hypothetical protein MJO29_008585 [Puccinia striiformis f. sp. tritici]